jgi:membrane protein YqaA with SNARE-associated domain
MQSSSQLYTRLERHAASRGALIISFLWGLAEATAFFIIPDVYLGFVALFCRRKGLRAALSATAGAVIGGAIMYTLATAHGASVDRFLVRIPLIDTEMVHTVAQQTQDSGLIAMANGPRQTIPYKIYATQAGQQQLPLIPFLLVTIPVRLVRFAAIILTAGAIGAMFKKSVHRRTAFAVGIYILTWIGVYLSYYLRLRG